MTNGIIHDTAHISKMPAMCDALFNQKKNKGKNDLERLRCSDISVYFVCGLNKDKLLLPPCLLMYFLFDSLELQRPVE